MPSAFFRELFVMLDPHSAICATMFLDEERKKRATNEEGKSVSQQVNDQRGTEAQSAADDRAADPPTIQPAYKAFIFDLDGTLLHTLPDLVNVTNKALADQGFPPHTPEEILTFVGDGAARLIAQAVPDGATPEQEERVFQNFKAFYHDFGILYTTEFDGMTEALQQAKAAGIKLGILSNKFEQGVLDVRDRFFAGLIEVAHGESEAIPRKPDPTGLLLCARELDVDPAECLFFGDSASDIMAAHHAGMKGVAVMWGYQPHQRLMSADPDYVIKTPAEMLALAGL